MLKKDIQIGGRYIAKVSNQLTTVRITGTNKYGGWNAVNEATKRDVRVKSAAKLRGPAEPKQAPVTNGNGERMMTANQRDLIEKLLHEKVVDTGLVRSYQAAQVEGTVTLEAASTFIKHLIASDRVSDRTVTTKEVVAKKATKAPVKPNVPKNTRLATYSVILTGKQVEDIHLLLDFAETSNPNEDFTDIRIAVDTAELIEK